MRCFLLMLLLLTLPALAAPSVAYVVDIAKSAAWFEVSYWGGSTVKGKLSLLQGRVEFDEGAKNGRGEIGFDMNSVQTGREFINDFVKSKQIFDTATYPTMSFRPSRFEFVTERLLFVEGDLILHGVTRPVRLDVKRFTCQESMASLLFEISQPALDDLPLNMGKNACYGEFSTSISRAQFGMDSLSLMVSDTVNISVNLVLQKAVP